MIATHECAIRLVWPLHDELLPLLCNMIVEGELDAGCKLAAQWNEATDDREDILTALYRRDGAHLSVVNRMHDGQLLAGKIRTALEGIGRRAWR